MFKNINFDHTYNDDKGFKYFNKLGKLGFVLEDSNVEHPGKTFCKFIKLDSLDRPFYLEFINIKIKDAKTEPPGLSFRYKKSIYKYSKKIISIIDHIVFHKNYHWKENDKDILPGWNYLKLKNTPYRNIYIWFTEYEPYLGKKKPKKAPKHPNGVYGLYSIDMTLTPKAHDYLEKLFGKKFKSDLQFSDGVKLTTRTGRATRQNHVVLKCKSFKKMEKYITKPKYIEYHGIKALEIENPTASNNSWTILVVEA